MKQCDYCNKETSNPRFCSKSCSAKKTNTESVKRKITRQCVKCTNLVRSYKDSLCQTHFQEKRDLDKLRAPSSTLAEYRSRPSVVNKHSSWRNAHIRLLNRSWNKSMTKQPCKNCGYNKHVELAHIKAVTSFPETATLAEVNSSANVIPLCPNCHWEFDHGLLLL